MLVEVAIAGVRAAAGDLAINAGGNLTSVVLDFTTLGLTVGPVDLHVGGVDALNRFANAANFGFARVKIIAAHKLTLEKRDNALRGGRRRGVAVDLLFGQFVRNVAVDHADFLQPSTQFELPARTSCPAAATGYEYALGNWCDTLSIAIPLTGKATMTVGFVGTNTTDPATVRALNAANAKVGGLTGAFGTSSILRACAFRRSTRPASDRLQERDLHALEQRGRREGARHPRAQVPQRRQHRGRYPVADAVHQPGGDHGNPVQPHHGLDFALKNGDGGVLFDLPTGTLTGGGRDYPANQSVAVNTVFQAHEEGRQRLLSRRQLLPRATRQPLGHPEGGTPWLTFRI
jgi:hypothetical protein